jgi:hypothetical protein
MRTIATILLAALLTLTQTPLGQLMKLPVLIEHFCKHKRCDGVSLLGFLNDHYTSKHNDADQSEDERLPFKTIIVQHISIAVMPSVSKTDFSLCFDIPAKLMLPDFYTPQQHLCSIFHPPRV